MSHPMSRTAESHDAATRHQPEMPVLVVVDPRAAGWHDLVSALSGPARVVVADPKAEGLCQIAAALSVAGPIRGLAIVARGRRDAVALGCSEIGSITIAMSPHTMSTIRAHLGGRPVEIHTGSPDSAPGGWLLTILGDALGTIVSAPGAAREPGDGEALWSRHHPALLPEAAIARLREKASIAAPAMGCGPTA